MAKVDFRSLNGWSVFQLGRRLYVKINDRQFVPLNPNKRALPVFTASDFNAPILLVHDLGQRMARNETPRKDVSAEVTLVPHGYQIDVYLNSKHLGFECRDFGGSYPIKKMGKVVAAALVSVMNKVEKGYKQLHK